MRITIDEQGKIDPPGALRRVGSSDLSIISPTEASDPDKIIYACADCGKAFTSKVGEQIEFNHACLPE